MAPPLQNGNVFETLKHGRWNITTLLWWPLPAVHWDIVIHLAPPQSRNTVGLPQRLPVPLSHRKERDCSSRFPPVSAALAIRSNQCYRSPFPVVGKCSSALEQSPPHKKTYSPTYWNTYPVGITHNAFFPSTYAQLPVREMSDLPKRKWWYISSLTSQHDPLDASKDEFTFLQESLPTHIVHHQDGWLSRLDL